jgi:hypothetical protein
MKKSARLFLTVILSLCPLHAPAQSTPKPDPLFNTIKQQDTRLFDAYNHCDMTSGTGWVLLLRVVSGGGITTPTMSRTPGAPFFAWHYISGARIQGRAFSASKGGEPHSAPVTRITRFSGGSTKLSGDGSMPPSPRSLLWQPCLLPLQRFQHGFIYQILHRGPA